MLVEKTTLEFLDIILYMIYVTFFVIRLFFYYLTTLLKNEFSIDFKNEFSRVMSIIP